MRPQCIAVDAAEEAGDAVQLAEAGGNDGTAHLIVMVESHQVMGYIESATLTGFFAQAPFLRHELIGNLARTDWVVSTPNQRVEILRRRLDDRKAKVALVEDRSGRVCGFIRREDL
ncbi:hypothetical protein RNZ50_17610 [Paracoccaceae bacterium Fryx2]|nr:hypothetical protein [Paracoccaceae bacterium Fryx2]